MENVRKVLVVDDSETMRELVAEHLESEGYGVDQAGDGFEALEIYEKSIVDYFGIVTDMIMPGMNGVELAGEVRHRGYKGPVVLSTGTPERLTNEMRKYFSAVLCKPYNFKDLFAALEQPSALPTEPSRGQ